MRPIMKMHLGQNVTETGIFVARLVSVSSRNGAIMLTDAATTHSDE